MPIQELVHKYSFRAALFIIAKKWKQTKCLSTDEWTKTKCGASTGSINSATKRILTHATPLMNPQSYAKRRVRPQRPHTV